RRGALMLVTGGWSVPVTRDAATGGRRAAGRTCSGRTDASRPWAPKNASSGIASAASASSMDIAYVPIASVPVVTDIASSGSVAAPLPRFRSPSTRAAATLAPAASAVARTLRRVGPPPDGIRFLALSILYLSRQNDPLATTVRCRDCVRTVAVATRGFPEALGRADRVATRVSCDAYRPPARRPPRARRGALRARVPRHRAEPFGAARRSRGRRLGRPSSAPSDPHRQRCRARGAPLHGPARTGARRAADGAALRRRV